MNTNYNDKTGEYTQLNTVDVSVAVATDAGLITPIVKDADKLEVLGISERVKVMKCEILEIKGRFFFS